MRPCTFLLRSRHLQAAITGGVDRYVCQCFGLVESGFHGRGLSVLALPVQAFDVAVKTPYVVRVLSGSAQRRVQTKIVPVHLFCFDHAALFQQQRA